MLLLYIEFSWFDYVINELLITMPSVRSIHKYESILQNKCMYFGIMTINENMIGFNNIKNCTL